MSRKQFKETISQQLNDITLEWTPDCRVDKDELYVKDKNIEIKLKNRHLYILVFIPQTEEHFKFHYIVAERRFEREYNTLNDDDRND